jgi:hypothetical protein
MEGSKKRPGRAGRPVVTPLGQFPSIQAAASAYGLSPGAVASKLKSEKEVSWYFVGEEKAKTVSHSYVVIDLRQYWREKKDVLCSSNGASNSSGISDS